MMLILPVISTAAPQTSKWSFTYTETGKGQPLIFIPGLDCSGKVWGPTVDKLKSKYECIVLTLPGFGGVAPIKADSYTGTIRDQVIQFIQAKHLAKPIIIGHSLGGFLAWSIATQDSNNLGGIVCVDGVPFLAALSNPMLTGEMTKPYADTIKKAIDKESSAQFRSQGEEALKQMVSSQKDIDWVEKVSGPPDQGTTGQIYAEMMSTDLRPELSKVTCPAFQMMAGKNMTDAQRPEFETRYKDQIKGAKNTYFYDFKDAKHFIFLDQPAEFMTQLTHFLDKITKS